MSEMNVLFAAAEVFPLAKTGGLADVAAALPAALKALGVNVHIIMPAYRGLAERLRNAATLAQIEVRGQRTRLIGGGHPDNGVPMLLLDAPELYARDGSPYADRSGQPYADNALRFACFCEAVARIAQGAAGAGLAADIVHLNDWHTGLVPVYLGDGPSRPRTLFTIHNLAYQGIYDHAEYRRLGLPEALWHPGALEFYGGFSFMKAGLLFADKLSTVSPSYAREIQTPQFGERLDGVLRQRADDLCGILNGIDPEVWNPASDSLIEQRYDAATVVAGKHANKRALQRDLGLDPGDDPLLAFIGRLAYQKGADALLAARPELSAMPLQIVILASGDAALERDFQDWAAAMPERVAVRASYDEALAHRIEAAADMLIMPSRFEPCGLNQMYSLAYGTIPLVRNVGGLADSVADIDSAEPTGIVFQHSDASGVSYAVRTACERYAQPDVWRRMQQAGMARRWEWQASATHYVDIYRSLLTAVGRRV
ncbi:MAG: glycogen synthase GlgA [Lysobacterales bacterium]